MSKKVILFTLLGLAVVAALLITNFGKNLPFISLRTPVYTAEIPETRPVRLDQRLLERFEGESMSDILAVLVAEKAASQPTMESDSPGLSEGDKLLKSLPDGPFPFSKADTPEDSGWLKEYVTSMKRDEGTAPSQEEIWRFNLALAALQISPDQLPDALKLDEVFNPEIDTLPVTFTEIECDFTPPFTIGNFDDSPDLEVIDLGGTRLSKISDVGSAVPVEGHGIRFAGSRLYPADFDQDGDIDLYLIRPEGFPNSLFRNDGTGRFEDVTIELGLLSFNNTAAAAWIDYDGDGRLDLLEGSSDHPLKLYHQTGGGAFQPVAWDLKLWVHRGVRELKCADLSGDGIDDLFIGIDDQPDRLLITKTASAWDAWRFEDTLTASGTAVADDHDLTFLDFNHDGALDLALYGKTADGSPFFRISMNAGESNFEDATETLGFTGAEAVESLAVLDIDQDGFEDLYLGTPRLELNRSFWNRAGLSFREISITTHGGFLDVPAETYVADLDQNGLNELLYANQDGKVRWLEPRGSSAAKLQVFLSRAVPGAKAVANVRDVDWILQPLVYTLGSLPSISIGVGEADVVEELSLLSPDGKTTLFKAEKLAPNEAVSIDLPASRAK